MTAYYNEIDPYAAQHLRNLIAAGHLPTGDVDERSIEDVRPDELAGYTQCHFFAGIGGWPYALALAGWPVDRPVWTGSCPCQPFSAAGKDAGFADQRHLWPAWFHLIAQCRPATVFGEQVAAAIGHAWLDGVCADMEGQGYAIGAAVLPACAAGAPHRRDRLWFGASIVDHADDARLEGFARHGGDAPGWQEPGRSAAATGRGSALADANCVSGQVDSHAERRADGSGAREVAGLVCAGDGTLAHADRERSISRESPAEAARHGNTANAARASGAWDNHAWITGHDGKARRVEPSIRLLAYGVPARVGRLRAYGNAIVPQTAAAFIESYLDIEAAESEVEAA